MSTNGTNARDPINSFRSIIGILRAEEARNLNDLMADEFSNHVNIRSMSGSNTGRFDGRDMQLIWERCDLLIRTIRLFQGGPEAYAPRNHDADALTAVEMALQAQRGE